MAKETLSVELDSRLVDRVRRYSREHGTDVAGTIGELIELLPVPGTGENGHAASETDVLVGIAPSGSDDSAWEAQLSPRVRRILGAGAGDADEADYYRYLEEKYGR